jgi:hypothetical protein
MTGVTFFRRLLAPHGPETFLAGDGRLRAMCWAAGDGRLDPFGAMAHPKQLEVLVRAGAAEHLDVLRGGIGQPPSEPVDAILEQARAGRCSLRIRRVQSLDASLRDLAVQLAAEIGEEVNFNLYWSAREGAGLGGHHDPYDIFVLQLAGAKRWTLLGGEGFEEAALAPCEGGTSGTAGELELGAGDVLFLPAGLRHRAHAIGPEGSLHLTLGIYAKTAASVLEWLIEEAAAGLGSPLPDRPPFREIFEALVEDVARAVAAAAAAPDRLARFGAYRRAVEYERTVAPPREHERLSGRAWRGRATPPPRPR